MRSSGDIRHKIQQVRYRYLQKRIRTSLSRRPTNCQWNAAVETNGREIRYCEHPDQYGKICDESITGFNFAPRCEFFVPSKTKEQVRQEFDDFIRESTNGEIAQEFPDLVALAWALGEDPDSEDIEHTGSIEESKPKRTFWSRIMSLLIPFARIRWPF